jgi:Leucine-rich repeat (LRR) protein
MITNLTAVQTFEVDNEQISAISSTKTTAIKVTTLKVKQFSKWINPKNWFNRFASIEIDMSEFACKKALPKE